VPDWVKLSFEYLTSGHSDAQGWASECSDVRNYKWRLNPLAQGALQLYPYGNSGRQRVNNKTKHKYNNDVKNFSNICTEFKANQIKAWFMALLCHPNRKQIEPTQQLPGSAWGTCKCR